MASGTVGTGGTFSTLEAAIAQAQFGDVLSLIHTQTFAPQSGTFTFGTPGGSSANGYVTVQSDLLLTPGNVFGSSYPITGGGPDYSQGFISGARVNANWSQYMPKVVATTLNTGAVTFAPGAHHWRLRGLEILPQTIDTDTEFLLVDINALTQSSTFPDHIWLDQCYIHAYAESGTFHIGTRMFNGVYAICNRLDISNCCIMEIKSVRGSREAHAILLPSGGNGPFSLVNSYVEGSTHCVLVGGQAPVGNTVVGTALDSKGVGIRYQYNTFARNPAWNSLRPGYQAPATSPSFPGVNSSGGDWLLKVLTEFKSGQNILIDHNVYQYNWAGDQTGQAISSNISNYSGAGVEIFKNVTITNNVIDSVVVPFEFAQATGEGNCQPCNPTSSEIPTNVTVRNNLATNVAWQYEGISSGATGNTRTRDLYTNQCIGLTYDHNTIVNLNTSGYPSNEQSGFTFTFSSSSQPATGVAVTNSICVDGAYGTFNTIDSTGASVFDNLATLNALVPSANVQKNVFYGIGKTPVDVYAKDFVVGSFSAVGLTTGSITFLGAGRVPVGGDGSGTGGNSLTLTTYSPGSGSVAKGAATDGTDIGVNVSALAWAAVSSTATTTTIVNSPIILAQGAAATPPCTGTNVLVLVNVTASGGTVTGNVTLNLNPGPTQTTFGPIALSSGQATFCIPQPAVGTYTLAANFVDPSGKWSSSTGSGSLQVTGPKPAPTITITPTPTAYPNNWPITVNVAPPSGQTAIPSGNVTLSIDGTAYAPLAPNTDGNAWFRINGIGGGSHTLSVFYGGDGNYASTTQNATGTITAAPDQMSVNVTTPIQVGQNATVTVSVTNQPPADTTITINGTLTYQIMTGFGAQYSILGAGTQPFGTTDVSVSQLAHIGGLLFGQLKVNILAGQNLHEMQGTPPTNGAIFSGTPGYQQDSNPTDTNANFAGLPSKTGLYPSLSSFTNWHTTYTDREWNNWLNAPTDLSGTPTPKQLLGSNLYWFGCSEAHPLNIRYEDRWVGDLRDNTNLSGHYPSGVGANGQQKFLYCIARQVLAQLRYMELAFGYVPPWYQVGAEAISGLRTLQDVNNQDTYSTGNTQEVVDLIQKICDTIRTAGYSTKVVICCEDACGPQQEVPSSLSLAQFVLPKLTAQALQNVGAIAYHQNPYGSTYCVLGGSPVSILATSGSGVPVQGEINDRQTLAALAKQYGLQVWMVAMSHGNVEPGSGAYTLTSVDGTSFDTLRGRAVDIHDQILYANASVYMLQGMYWSTNGAASPPDPINGVNGVSLTTLAQYSGADMLVLGDIPSNTWIITMGGYAMGHYSRWLLTGDMRIDAQSTNAMVQVVAFKRASPSTAIVVLINNDTASHTVALNLLGINWTGTITGEQSTAGNIYIPLSQSASGSSAVLTLPARSVTSLAGPAQ